MNSSVIAALLVASLGIAPDSTPNRLDFGQGFMVQKGALDFINELPVCTAKDNGYWEVIIEQPTNNATLLLSKVDGDVTQSFCRIHPHDKIRPLYRKTSDEALG